MRNELSVKIADNINTCNVCYKRNYDGEEYTIYELRLGVMISRLCKDCIETLVGKIVMEV